MPQIQVWINKDDEANVEKFVKALNEELVAHKDQKLKVFFIFVDENGKALESKLVAMAERAQAPNVCLAYLSPSNEAVGNYKVNLATEVKSTFMLYRNRQVKANEVNLVADKDGLAKLKADIALITK